MLRHKVTVRRPVDAGTEDALGQAVEAMADVATNVPAFVQERTGREVPVPDDQGTTIITATVYFLPRQDVRASDRIRRVDNGREYRVLYVRDPAGMGRLLAADCMLGQPVVGAPTP